MSGRLKHDHALILKYWATTTFTAEHIGGRFGVPRNTVLRIVSNARKAGNPQAVYRCKARANNWRGPAPIKVRA